MQRQRQERLVTSSPVVLARGIVCGKPVRRWASLRKLRVGPIRIVIPLNTESEFDIMG
jgi:hypothetical protein